MTDECISPLRRRMIEDMTVRNFAAKTQDNYIGAVAKLARFLGRLPDTATAEELRLFQLHLTRTASARRPSTVRLRRCGSSSPLRSIGPTSSST